MGTKDWSSEWGKYSIRLFASHKQMCITRLTIYDYYLLLLHNITVISCGIVQFSNVMEYLHCVCGRKDAFGVGHTQVDGQLLLIKMIACLLVAKTKNKSMRIVSSRQFMRFVCPAVCTSVLLTQYGSHWTLIQEDNAFEPLDLFGSNNCYFHSIWIWPGATKSLRTNEITCRQSHDINSY